MSDRARTHVDWLALRTQSEPLNVLGALRGVFGTLGSGVALKHRQRGWQGYRQAADVQVEGMTVGMLAYGGENQRGWVHLSLTGQGCGWITDWDLAQEAIDTLDEVSLRRVDIALDTIGAEVGHDSVLEAYRAGLFTTAGRPPKCQRIETERPEDGRTIYIGSRENDKFFRGYEKGLQLVSGTGSTHVGSVPAGDLYRCELEIKAKSGALPDDLIENRDQYFAGSYPYLQHVLRDIQPVVMQIDRRLAAKCELDRRLSNIQAMFGTSLFTALTVHHGDIGAVWAKICGTRHNDDLVEAGALLVEVE
jgi:phage replication initiation protein